MQLRAYQSRAIDALRSAMQQGARAPLLCLPTGGGKTCILASIAAQAAAKGRQVLILVHRRELIHQTASKLAWAGLEHGVIAAGHTETKHSVRVASVQTLVRRLSRMDWCPSLVIIDEAHHAAAGSWRKILEHWPNAYRLGVTATPCRLDGRGLAEAFDHLVLGPSVADLVFWGFLSSARIYAPPMVADLSGVRRRAGDYANDQAAAAMDRPTVTGDAIAHYQRLAAGQQAIAFCCNVAHAVSVCDAFKTAGISAALLLGNTSDRDAVVAQYAAGVIRILVTVDVVSEGFDVPAASCAILLRPTQSLGLYLQQVGRVLRPAPGKPNAIILDHVGNVTRHGFPDDPRQWSLAEGAVRSRGTAAPSVRTCPQCYAAFKPQPQCPVCGAQCAPIKSRKIQQLAGELQELRRDFEIGDKVEVWFADEGWMRLYKVIKTYDAWNRHGNKGPHADLLCLETGLITEGDTLTEIPFDKIKLISKSRREQGKARTLPELIALGQARGMKNPVGWAKHVYFARQRS